ncbi:MAG: hypothetical protein WC476_06170 [Phycisphaerae bacterium]|jgi:hypothetical protein
MRLYTINPRVILINNRLIALFAVTFICIFPCVGLSSNPNNPAEDLGSEHAANQPLGEVSPSADVNDVNGPAVMLNYGRRPAEKNPISSFMYFVPLLSPTFVDRETSADNEQQVALVSYEKNITSKSFYVTCEFKMLGKGFQKNNFDPVGMIAEQTAELKQGETLTSALDYIKFEGEGLGSIEVKGTIADSIETVTEVVLRFNARDQKSPVTFGLYDVEPKDGQYKYENRSNETIARVNTLTFEKSETPKMGIEIASIHKKTDVENYWGAVKAVIANYFFINPPKVTKLGNDTMLNFGYALLKQKPAFTFTRAKNLRENRNVAIDNKQN